MAEAAAPESPSIDWYNMAGKVASSGIDAASSNMSSKASNKEKRRRRKTSEVLDLLRNRLSSKNQNRESQNQMEDAYAELLANKAAQFRQAVS